MPQVPRLTGSQVALRPLQLRRAQAVPTGLADAGEVVSQAAFQLAQDERQRIDRAAVTEASKLLGDAENELLFDAENGAFARRGKNAFDLPSQVFPEFDKRAGKIAEGLTSQRQREVFAQDLAQRRQGIQRELDRHEMGERDRYYDETDESRIVTSIQAAANYADRPDRLAAELDTQRAVLEGMAKRKGWDEVTKAEKRAAFESKTHEAVIGRLLTLNQYSKAGRYLAANAGRMRDEAVEQMQRRVILEEEQAYQRSERERKRLGDQVTKDGDKLLREGALTSDWLERNRHTLDPEDYRYFSRKLSGVDGDGPSDPMLYSELRDRAGRGEDVRQEAREALRRQQIGTSDYDRILGEVEGNRPGWYKRGKDFISTSAAVSDLNPDPAAAQRKAAMVNDWDEWVERNPKATDAEARQAAERIVNEYALIDISQLPLVKRTPTYLKGGRTAPDMDATAAETVRAFEAGEIDRAEFERQAQLIKEWEDALRLQPKPKASNAK